MNDIADHYDILIDENNDPVHDPKPLRDYMDKWDGQNFIDEMELNKSKTVLEIGVGTGRLAIRVAPLCKEFLGLDISPKTVERARENLKMYPHSEILCMDFMKYCHIKRFDVIYSSLTFMHFKDKRNAIEKVKTLLNNGGRFVLSIDKNQEPYIDYGTRKILIFPDQADTIIGYIKQSGMKLLKKYETEFAYVLVSTLA